MLTTICLCLGLHFCACVCVDVCVFCELRHHSPIIPISYSCLALLPNLPDLPQINLSAVIKSYLVLPPTFTLTYTRRLTDTHTHACTRAHTHTSVNFSCRSFSLPCVLLRRRRSVPECSVASVAIQDPVTYWAAHQCPYINTAIKELRCLSHTSSISQIMKQILQKTHLSVKVRHFRKGNHLYSGIPGRTVTITAYHNTIMNKLQLHVTLEWVFTPVPSQSWTNDSCPILLLSIHSSHISVHRPTAGHVDALSAPALWFPPPPDL